MLPPCKQLGKTVSRPQLIPLIKTALACRCQGHAAVFKETLAPRGPSLQGNRLLYLEVNVRETHSLPTFVLSLTGPGQCPAAEGRGNLRPLCVH